MNQDDLREKVARIIHPWPFTVEVEAASVYDGIQAPRYRESALAKADAILALLLPGDGGGATEAAPNRPG